jgi:serine phosphatase RsbU (regulator of sigma subunit)
MNLRLRLIVAFFLLSVVPLTAVTYVSYASSAAAFQEAAEREADRQAGDLAQRMQMVTAQLGERVEHLLDVSELEARVDAAGAPATSDSVGVPESGVEEVDRQVAEALGAAAMLLNNVELHGLRRRGRGGPSSAPSPPGTPSAPQPADETVDRLEIDLGSIRRDLLRQMTQPGQEGGVSLEEMTPEQRGRFFRELNARITMGITEGIQLTAAELQRRAGAAAAGAPVPVAPASPRTRTVSALRDGRLGVTVERDGEVVRELSAEVNLPNMLSTVFATTRRDQGEVPFAVGRDGRIFARSSADRETIGALGVVATPGGPATARVGDWIVMTTTDPAGMGLRLGIARPVGDSLADLRRAAGLNLAIGLGFIAVALIGIVPLSTRLTRNLSVLSDGVERIAQGDYRARVPVRSQDEIGQLALAFNRMAADVEQHQNLAVERERIRRELELGRRIQNDMLPHAPLRLGLTEILGVSVPAREVGGDFFNYFELPDGRLAMLVGDVSGKGVGAALLMANIQAALRTRLSLGQDLPAIADAIDRDVEVNSPGPVYATLFVGIFDPVTRELRYVNAGHHPQYVLRRAGGLERMSSTGLPVGMIAGRGYTEQRVQLAAGDLLFFYTDGCVEAENDADDMFGSARLEAMLASGGADAEDVLVRVEQAVKAFRGAREASDDATTMAVKIG